MPDLEPTEEEEAVSTHLFASSDERPRMTVSEWTPVENRVKIGDEIRFKFDETDPEWTQVTIIEPAGKKGGLYDTFYNVDCVTSSLEIYVGLYNGEKYSII